MFSYRFVLRCKDVAAPDIEYPLQRFMEGVCMHESSVQNIRRFSCGRAFNV